MYVCVYVYIVSSLLFKFLCHNLSVLISKLKGICFIMRAIPCHGNLVCLVQIFLKFHTRIVIGNRDLGFFGWNFSNRFQNFMLG